MYTSRFMDALRNSKDATIQTLRKNISLDEALALADLCASIAPLPAVNADEVQKIVEKSIPISSIPPPPTAPAERPVMQEVMEDSIPISSISPSSAAPRARAAEPRRKEKLMPKPKGKLVPEAVEDTHVTLTKQGRHIITMPHRGEDGRLRNVTVGGHVTEAIREFVMQSSLWEYWGFKLWHNRKSFFDRDETGAMPEVDAFNADSTNADVLGKCETNVRTRKSRTGKDIVLASVMAVARSDLKTRRVPKWVVDYFGFNPDWFVTEGAWNERLVGYFVDIYNKIADGKYDGERDQVPVQPRDNLVLDGAPRASEFQSDVSEDGDGATKAEANAITRQAEALINGRTLPELSFPADTQPPEWSDLPGPELAPHSPIGSPLAPAYDNEPRPKYPSIEAALKDGMTMQDIHDEIAEDQLREPHEKLFPADIGRVSGKCPRSLTAAVNKGKQMKRRRGMPAPAEGFGDE